MLNSPYLYHTHSMTIDIHSHDETSPTPEHGAASPESIHHMQTSGEKATEIGKQ